MKALKKFTSLILCIVLLIGIFPIGNAVIAEEETRNGVVVISSGSLNVRSQPSTSGKKLGSLSAGDEVVIYGEDIKDSDGGVWYKIKFETKDGYVSADYIQIIYEYVPDADFEANLTAQKFPESYKELLRKLHAAHPEWIFLADHLSMDFKTALAEESKVGKTLVAGSAVASQKSMDLGAYNWISGSYEVFDSGGWVTADKDTIAYYMEPRNFLNEANIFLFLDQGYNSDYQTVEGLNKIMDGTFMDSDNAFPEDAYKTYADVLIEAAKQSKVNPYILAAMILVEQGTKGTGGSISGKVSGYEGYYNFFNISAYAKGGYSAVQYGLRYAKGLIGGNGTSYNRPWNTRVKSIIGGAKYYGTNYVARGQDTLYYKKYNVIVPNYYANQYMTNVSGAVQEAANLRKVYSGVGAGDMPLVFSIPVYKNTTDTYINSLSTSAGANNYYLESLKVLNGDKTLAFSPTFDRYTNDYTMSVGEAVDSIEVKATVPSGAKVSGAGKITLKAGTNTVKLTVTAASGKTAVYTLTVQKAGDVGTNPDDTSSGGGSSGTEEIPEPQITGNYNNGTNITGVAPETSVKDFITNLKVVNGTTTIQDSSGVTKTSGSIVTGDKVVVKDLSGSIKITKSIVIYGDVNSDGKITGVDLIRIQKGLIDLIDLSGAVAVAADVNHDGKVTGVDLIRVQKHLIKLITIEQ